jgi:hypothetical protein
LIYIDRKIFKWAVGRFRELADFRANELMETGIAEHNQSLAKKRPAPPEASAKKFKFRTNKLLEERIIERGQEVARPLSAARAGRFGADYTPGS